MASAASLLCPTCGTPVPIPADQRPESFPFCSARCRVRDLGAWAEGRHVVPGAELRYDGYETP